MSLGNVGKFENLISNMEIQIIFTVMWLLIEHHLNVQNF